MKHEEIQDLLEDYVDERLDRPTRKVVDSHLADCAECRAILDQVAPVDLTAISGRGIDERVMRRAIRRSMVRTAVDAALLLLTGLIAIWLVAALVLQPFLVNRGDRAADLAQASIDIPLMTNPGAVVVAGSIESSLLRRNVDLIFGLPVGSVIENAFESKTTIGLFGLGDQAIPESNRLGVDFEYGGDAKEVLANLGSGTVATVNLWFENPVSIEEAQQLADEPKSDVRVVWAGFDLSSGSPEGPRWSASGVLGYPTCGDTSAGVDRSILAATSAGFHEMNLYSPSSISGALRSIERSLENIAGRGELIAYLAGDSDSAAVGMDEARATLRNDPMVRQLVVTGPSPEVGRFLDSLSGLSVGSSIVAVDFYNWSPGICGR